MITIVTTFCDNCGSAARQPGGQCACCGCNFPERTNWAALRRRANALFLSVYARWSVSGAVGLTMYEKIGCTFWSDDGLISRHFNYPVMLIASNLVAVGIAWWVASVIFRAQDFDP